MNKLTGKSDMVKGPCIWFPGPYALASELQIASGCFRYFQVSACCWGVLSDGHLDAPLQMGTSIKMYQICVTAH